VVTEALPAVIIKGGGTYCLNTPVTLDAGAGFATYKWNTGETTETITAPSGTAGTKSYSVTVSNSNGCKNTATATVTINALPVVSVTGGGTYCQNTPVTLNATAGFTSYTWSTGQTSASISAPTGTPGSTTYTVSVTDANGCTNTAGTDVTVRPLPSPHITGGGTYCENTAVTLDAGTGFAQYVWSTGQTTETIQPDNTTAGTRNYSVTVTDGNGCKNSADTTVTINALPAPTITGAGSYCQNSPVTLDAGAGFATYLWSTGATTQQISPDNVARGATTYTVTVTGANA
jgi:hypothetical protein